MNDSERLARLKSNVKKRAEIYQTARNFFYEEGFLEVETPERVPVVAPEQFITPIQSEDWFLITSPELHMKRMLAAGYPKLVQFCRCFRRGERGRLHNPEFSMIEWYRAGGTYLDIISDTEKLVATLSGKFGDGKSLFYQGKTIDLTLPWPRITVQQAFLKYAGWDPVEINDSLRFDMDLCEKVIPAFSPLRPTVLMDYPAPLASLARLKPDGTVGERAEVFIAGLEIANGFSELINRQEQERRFRDEIKQIEKDSGREAQLPEKFLDAMDQMPECAGMALGMDRLVMLFCDAASIDEVMAFTVDNI